MDVNVTGWETETTDVELERSVSVVCSAVVSASDLFVDLEVAEVVLEGFDEDDSEVSEAGKTSVSNSAS